MWANLVVSSGSEMAILAKPYLCQQQRYHWRCDTHLSDRCLELCSVGWSCSSNPCQTDFTQGPSSLESKRSVRTGRGSKAGGNAACEREHVCMSLGSCQWRGGLLVLFGLRTWDRAVRVIKIQILRTAVEYFREWVMTQTLPFLRPNSQALPRPMSSGHWRVC